MIKKLEHNIPLNIFMLCFVYVMTRIGASIGIGTHNILKISTVLTFMRIDNLNIDRNFLNNFFDTWANVTKLKKKLKTRLVRTTLWEDWEPSFSQKCEDGPTLKITYQWKTPPYQLALHRGASNNLTPTQKSLQANAPWIRAWREKRGQVRKMTYWI
jgi:hypothetical protein